MDKQKEKDQFTCICFVQRHLQNRSDILLALSFLKLAPTYYQLHYVEDSTAICGFDGGCGYLHNVPFVLKVVVSLEQDRELKSSFL